MTRTPTKEEIAARVAKVAATRARNKEIGLAYDEAAKLAEKENRTRQKSIKKLSQMTVANGCSEAEAASAQVAMARLSAKPKLTARDKVAPKYRPPPLPRTLPDWDTMRAAARAERSAKQQKTKRGD
jgi:hypothetical protein